MGLGPVSRPRPPFAAPSPAGPLGPEVLIGRCPPVLRQSSPAGHETVASARGRWLRYAPLMDSGASSSGHGRTKDSLWPPDESLLGEVLDGRYRMDDVLGGGAAGVVYRAHDLEGQKPVAVKVLCRELRIGGQTVSRFKREGKALAKLSHSHIVDIVGYGVAKDIPYIAMEFLEGRTLEDLLEPAEPLDCGLSLTIAAQMLSGLAYAHESQVVHRDLKPANVFLQQNQDGTPHVKLLDFGLAKFLAPDEAGMGQTLTRTGMVMGTPLYMAPEQAVGGNVDMRVDVYAAGSLLFEMLTGRPPFLADSHAELVKAHLLSPVPRLSELASGPVAELAPEVRGKLDGIVEQAMAKEPAERFAHAGAMLQAVRAVQAALPATKAVLLPAAVASGATSSGAAAEPSGPDTMDALEEADTVHLSRPPGQRRSGRPGAEAVAALKAMPAAASAKLGRRRWQLLLVAMAGLLALAVALFLRGPNEPSEPSALAVTRHTGPRLPPRDLWREQGVPEELSAVFAKVDKGQGITRDEMRDVLQFAREHAGDARPYLLLGHGFANRQWRRDAIKQYARAFRVDTSSRGDPHMLSDLLAITGSDKYGAAACDALLEIYGREALPAVREALGRTPAGTEHAKRLADLTRQIGDGTNEITERKRTRETSRRVD